MRRHRLIRWLARRAAPALLTLTVLLLAGCGDPAATDDPVEEPKAEAPTVKAALVVEKPFVESIDLPGATVRGFETAPLMAKVAGYVEEIAHVLTTKSGEVYSGALVAKNAKEIVLRDARTPTMQIAATDVENEEPVQNGATERPFASPPHRVTTKSGRVCLGKLAEKSSSGIILTGVRIELLRFSPDEVEQLDEVDIGSRVDEGAALAYLHVPEMLEELNQKRALLRQAKARHKEARTERNEQLAQERFRKFDYDNYVKLRSKQATTRELVEKAKAAYEAATAAVETADDRIITAEASVAVAEADLAHTQALESYATITAPFAGLVTRRMVDHGSFVRAAASNSSAKPLFELTRTDRVRIVAAVPMVRAERIQLDSTVVFHNIVGLPGKTVTGQIKRTAAALDMGSRMLRIEVHLDNPTKDAGYVRKDETWTQRKTAGPGEKVTLKPGMYGTLSVLRPWKNLRFVPATAIAAKGGQSFVMAVEPGKEEGTKVCRRKVVEVVYQDAKEVGFRGGPDEDQKVVEADASKLEDGQQVVVKAAPSSDDG